MRDSDGVITHIIVDREPEFTETDRAMLAAWYAWQKRQSPRGFSYEDEISPLADPDNPDGKYRFVADELPIVNHAERAEHKAREAYRKRYRVGDEDPDMTGLIWTVERVDRDTPPTD